MLKIIHRKHWIKKHTHTHTDDVIISTTDEIRSCKNNKNKPCILIFSYLAKAFDTINHKILLNKLHQYGFRGIVNKLLESYLTDGTQKVKVTFKVPIEGGLLSFADDTSITMTEETWEEVRLRSKYNFRQIVRGEIKMRQV